MQSQYTCKKGCFALKNKDERKNYENEFTPEALGCCNGSHDGRDGERPRLCGELHR